MDALAPYYTAVDQFALLPTILLALFGCAALLFDVGRRERRHLLLWTVLAGVAFTSVALWRQSSYVAQQGAFSALQGSLTIDAFGLFFSWLTLAGTLLVALGSYRAFDGARHGEYWSLLLLAQCGMVLLACGTDLVLLFVALEIVSLSFYVLVGFLRGSRRSSEAALKYMLLGVFSSGFMAYGFSLLFGMTGATRLDAITPVLAQLGAGDPLVLLAVVSTLVGLLFKVAAAPFHMWVPDAYEGAPTTVTAYLSVASKVAAFALLVRLLLGPFAAVRSVWEPLLAAAAVLSLTLGSLAALSQMNVKRLLAYSSVAHVGYVLLGLVAGGENGVRGMALYLLSYLPMTAGTFLLMVPLQQAGPDDAADGHIDTLTGLARRNPWLAGLMLLFLASLAGVPPTAGFLAKYVIFAALMDTGHYVLAVVAALYVAVSLYFYFRLVRTMFVEPAEQAAALPANWALRASLGLAGVLTVAIFVYPEPFISWAGEAVGR